MGRQFDVATLGIIASRRFGARAVQLPNRTSKTVAGVIDGHELVNLFGVPSHRSDTIEIKANKNRVPFLSAVPCQGTRIIDTKSGAIALKREYLSE